MGTLLSDVHPLSMRRLSETGWSLPDNLRSRTSTEAFKRHLNYLTSFSPADYVSSCGIPLIPVMYQVVGFGWGVDGRHSGSRRRSV